MATQVSGASRWLTINRRPLSFLPEDENVTLNIIEYSEYMIRSTQDAPDQLTIAIDDRQMNTEHYGRWNWRPKDYAGLYRLVATAPGYSPQTAWIRVFPQKLTQPTYEKMKAELSAIAIDLQFCLDSPALERSIYAPPSLEEASPLREYTKIQRIIEQLQDVMSHIRREPYRVLRKEPIVQDWQEMSTFSDEIVPLPGAYIRLPEAVARRHRVTYLPQSWAAQRDSHTYDMYEHRLLKQFVQQQLVAKLEIIQQRAEKERQRVEAIYARYHNAEDGVLIRKLQQTIENCRKMKQRCLHWSNEPFLKTVSAVALTGKATQMLLKHPNYSQFYRLYLQFQKDLKITHETERYVTDLAMRKVSALYEMWSVFLLSRMAIEELVAAGYHIVSRSLFYEVEKNYFQFDVQKNTASIVLEKEAAHVEFKYEPIYPNQSTIHQRSALVATTIGSNPLTPDMAIEVYYNGEPEQILIFDAKYRRFRDRDGLFYPNQEDIEKMYRYLNNIQYKRHHPGNTRNPSTLKRIVSSAYILYPGNKIHTESQNRIGGLPLIPSMSSQRLADVREHFLSLLRLSYFRGFS